MLKKQNNLNQNPEELPELMPDDGQTAELPPLPLGQVEAPEELPEEIGLPTFSETTATTNSYTADEFRAKFQSILEFLESPDAANDCAAELLANGRNLTADKIYNLASRYRWLNWIIDRRGQVLADSLQIAAFLAVESNLIVMNWTGLNLFEKAKIWLKNKAKERKEQMKNGQRRSLFGWVFSGHRAAAKATEPQN